METTLASERNLRAENSGLKEQNQSLQMQLKQYMDRDSNKYVYKYPFLRFLFI